MYYQVFRNSPVKVIICLIKSIPAGIIFDIFFPDILKPEILQRDFPYLRQAHFNLSVPEYYFNNIIFDIPVINAKIRIKNPALT